MPGSNANWVSSEHRKNARRFPVPAANHQRFVLSEVSMAADGNAATDKGGRKQKGRREAGLFSI
jgi:hypothetical protein